MKTTSALVALVSLVALSGLATSASGALPAHDLKRIDPSNLDDVEWAMQQSKGDPSTTSTMTLEVPAGGMIVGQVVNGQWTVSAVPPSAIPMAGIGVEPGSDCDVDSPSSGAYLTRNFAYPVLPNIYSAHLCDGQPGLSGAVEYLTFHTSGQYGGSMYLWGREGTFSVACGPAAQGAPVVMAGTGAGVGSVFQTTLNVANASCTVTSTGWKPSAWSSFEGSVWNSNPLGDTYGSVVSTWIGIGNTP